ncbi:MAG: porin [Balneolaceae bacterium]|nr:porin [Balneolaceae bacterium]
MKPPVSTLFSLIVFFLLFPPGNVHSQSKLDVGGYLQTWYIYQKQDVLYTSMGNLPVLNVQRQETAGFRIRRARLTAKGSLNETFSISSWVELATETPSLLDFYVDAEISKTFTVRAGQIMMPGQSYDTSRRFSSKLPFFERPSITTKSSSLMGYNAFRDIGLMAYGQVGKLWYGVQISNGLGRFQQAGSSFSERDFGSGLYGGRIDVEVAKGLELGGHISTNQQRNLIQNGSEPLDINRTSWSLRASLDDLLIPRFFAQAELIHFKAKDDNWGIAADPEHQYKLSGFYLETGYRITQNWHVLGRYDEMNEEPDQSLVSATKLYSNQYTFGITRFIRDDQKEISRIHLNYSFGESGPMNLGESILVLVLQVKFIP